MTTNGSTIPQNQECSLEGEADYLLMLSPTTIQFWVNIGGGTTTKGFPITLGLLVADIPTPPDHDRMAVQKRLDELKDTTPIPFELIRKAQTWHMHHNPLIKI